VSFGETVILAAFAGMTICLGLPVDRLRNISPTWHARLAAGVILFPANGKSSRLLERETAGRMDGADAP
jgi:hypothetical protein